MFDELKQELTSETVMNYFDTHKKEQEYRQQYIIRPPAITEIYNQL